MTGRTMDVEVYGFISFCLVCRRKRREDIYLSCVAVRFNFASQLQAAMAEL